MLANTKQTRTIINNELKKYGLKPLANYTDKRANGVVRINYFSLCGTKLNEIVTECNNQLKQLGFEETVKVEQPYSRIWGHKSIGANIVARAIKV